MFLPATQTTCKKCYWAINHKAFWKHSTYSLKTTKIGLSSAEKRRVEIFWALKCVLSDMSALPVDGVSDLSEMSLQKIFKWAELKSRISLTLLLHDILWKFLLMNWHAVIIIQFRLMKALMKPPKPVRWVYMFVIEVNLKIKHACVT